MGQVQEVTLTRLAQSAAVSVVSCRDQRTRTMGTHQRWRTAVAYTAVYWVWSTFWYRVTMQASSTSRTQPGCSERIGDRDQ